MKLLNSTEYNVANKYLMTLIETSFLRIMYILLYCWSNEPHGNPQTSQAKASNYSPQAAGKDRLLKISLTSSK